MNAQHTPGPWTYDGIAVRMPGGVGCVAMMATDCGDPIMEADARLIAAAPDLLAALKSTADELESVWRSLGQINPNRHVIAAREVISKLQTLN